MSDNQKFILNQPNGNYSHMEKYSSPVITVNPNASILDALLPMRTKLIKHVVVANETKVVGIITERDINKFLEQDKTSRSLNEISIKELRKKNPITIVVGQEDHLHQCAKRMETFKIGSVIVVDGDGNLVGITTKTDITKAYSQIYPGKSPVSEYMTRKVLTCRKSDSLKFALNMINSNNISRLVVTDNEGNPVGVITTNTFLRHSNYFKKTDSKSRNYLLDSESIKKLVGDLLNKNFLTIRFDEDLANAAKMMIENKIDGIPVLGNDKNLVGVISKHDIVRAFNQVIPQQKLLNKYWQFY